MRIQQVIDLRGGRFRLPAADLADGESLTLTVVAEENAEAAIALLQGGHGCPSGKDNAAPMSRTHAYKTVPELLGTPPPIRRKSLVPKVGLEPTRVLPHRILSPARLPFRHFG